MSHSLRTTRRSFLKHLGAAGAGAVALPHVLAAGAYGGTAANRKLDVALLACGNRMRQLLPSILGVGANVVAVCEVDLRQVDRLKKEAAEKHGDAGAAVGKAKVYDDYRKLLDDSKSFEAVVIATGQRWHVPLSKACLAAGKHVFCEKALAHSCAEAREIRQVARASPLVTQVGSQGGSTDTFRRSMEVIQAGLLGPIREVHCWINRSFPPSAPIDIAADPVPEGLNWDFWCGPSAVLPFKEHYIGRGLAWGRWLEFGDGHLGDMGAHGQNLPWRALVLGAAERVSVEVPEPLKDSYPSATKFRWDFPARGDLPPVTLWWHDGQKAGPPEPLAQELVSTYGKTPADGVLFVGEKGLLRSNAWGVGGVIKLQGDAKFRGVQDHEAAKPIPVSLPRVKGQDHMGEWADACRGGPRTFQGFETAADVAEIAMTGIVALRYGKPIEWDSAALKAKGEPGADPFIHREIRTEWL